MTTDTLREDHILARNERVASSGELQTNIDTGQTFFVIQRSDGSDVEIPLVMTSIFQLNECALCQDASTSFNDVEIVTDLGNAIVHYDCLTNDQTLTVVPYGSISKED